MPGINKVIIVGNLGDTPEVKYLNSGDAVTTISVATSETWKDKQTGEKKEKTEWHRIVMFKRLAEVAGEYLRKGSKVYVEGKLQTRKWQDNNGVDRYSTEIVVNKLEMLDSKSHQPAQQNQQQNQPAQQQGSQPQQNQQGAQGQGMSQQQQQQQAGQPAKQNTDVGFEYDDDIPF